MTFARAKQTLRKLAKGRYFSLGYDYNEHSSGNIKTECQVYIDKLGLFKGRNFEEALAELTGAVDESGQPRGDLSKPTPQQTERSEACV